jgi:hypothetical protein
MNIKVVMLVPLLLLSMFTIVPITTSQIAPSLAKISPTLWNEMANAGESINVLIKTFTNDYSSVVKQINDLGGNVGFLYKYVNALSASIPTNKIFELSKNSMIEKIYYDVKRELASGPGQSLMMPRGDEFDALLTVPTIAEAAEYEPIFITPAELASLEPVNYWNTKAMGAEDIWEETNYGEGSLVVIIDTGIWTGHFMFWGTSFLGGIDLSYDVGDPTYEGWDNINNAAHGGHVAGTIASTGGIIVSPGTRLYIYAQALEAYSGVPLPTLEDGSKIIWLLGMAPAATLYIIKVFDHTAGAIPESIVLAGMQHALDLKLEEGYDVDIISMSLGGPTLYDGRDIEGALVDTITANDITLVASAGNNGPASMTVGSPGAAYTAITAGAAANPVNTKAFWDYYYGWPGIGSYLFTSETSQIHALSSRGPTSDGRMKPTLSATGIFVLSAYTTGGHYIAWFSGTSMAAPAISGATALLNAYAEMNALGASPEDYRQALTGGAVWLPGYDEHDQGAGYLNAANALDVLKADTSYGDVPPPLPPTGTLEDITNIPIVGSGEYSTSIIDLPPGHKVEFVFEVTEATEAIRLKMKNVDLGVMNPLGINSFEVYIQSAKRTYYAYYVDSANVWGDCWFLINDALTKWKGPVTGVYAHPYTRVIEPGYMKIVIENDWTSYDNISADITIKVSELEPGEEVDPDVTITGSIAQDQFIGWYYFDVPKWAKDAKIQIWWVNGWDKYPTNDIDIYVYWDMGMNYDGATLNAPETVKLKKPTFIYIGIYGYAVYTDTEDFELRIYFSK